MRKKLALIIVAALLLNTLLPFIPVNRVYAKRLEYYKSLPKQHSHHIASYVPESVYVPGKGTLYFNSEIWEDKRYGVIVYGGPKVVDGQNYEYNEKTDTYEYRYLGYDSVGNRVTNKRFPDDVPNSIPGNKKHWYHHPWKEGLGTANSYDLNSKCKDDINRLKDENGWEPEIDHNGNPLPEKGYWGNGFVQSYPKLFGRGSWKGWHYDLGQKLYQTEIVPEKEEKIEPGFTVKTEILSSDFLIEENDYDIKVKVKVTAKLEDDEYYKDDVMSVLKYTRDDIDRWYVKLKYLEFDDLRKKAPYVQLKPEKGKNTASNVFEFRINREQVVDNQTVIFDGIARVVFIKDNEMLSNDPVSRVINVEYPQPVVPDEPPPAIEYPPGITLNAPSEAGVNEEYTVEVTPYVPEGESIKTLTLEGSFDGGTYKNIPLTYDEAEGKYTAKQSYSKEGIVRYRTNITISNDKEAQDTGATHIMDTRTADCRADVVIPENIVYEGHKLIALNRSKYTFEGKEYFAATAEEMGIGESEMAVCDNSEYPLDEDLYKVVDWDAEEKISIIFDDAREISKGKICLTEYPINQPEVMDVESFRVLPCPHINYRLTGARKDDRKLTLDFSDTVTHPEHPLVDSKTYVEIEDESTGEKVKLTKKSSPDSTHIKTLLLKNNKVDFLIKAAEEKTIKITIYVEDDRGISDTRRVSVKIKPDIPPVAEVTASLVQYRDTDGVAKVKIGKSGRSTDGDKLIINDLKYKVDSDNDGSFDDEILKDLSDSLTDLEAILQTDKVGKILLDYTVKEDLTPDTIPQFVSPEDYLSNHTTEIIDVDNLNPHTRLRAIGSQKMDIMFAIDQGKRDELDKRLAELKTSLNQENPASLKTDSINEMDIAPSSDPERIVQFDDYSVTGRDGDYPYFYGATNKVFLTEDKITGKIFYRDFETGQIKYALDISEYNYEKTYYDLEGETKKNFFTSQTGKGYMIFQRKSDNMYFLFDVETQENVLELGETVGRVWQEDNYLYIEGGEYKIDLDTMTLEEQIKDGFTYSTASYCDEQNQIFGYELYRTDNSTGEKVKLCTIAQYEEPYQYRYFSGEDDAHTWRSPSIYITHKVLSDGKIFITYTFGKSYKAGSNKKRYYHYRHYLALLDADGNLIKQTLLMPEMHDSGDNTAHSRWSYDIYETEKYILVKDSEYDTVHPYRKSDLKLLNNSSKYQGVGLTFTGIMIFNDKAAQWADSHNEIFTYQRYRSSSKPRKYALYVYRKNFITGESTKIFDSGKYEKDMYITTRKVIGNDRFFVVYFYDDDNSVRTAGIVDFETGECYSADTGYIWGSQIVIYHNNKIYLTSYVGGIHCYDLETGECTRRFDLSSGMESWIVSPNGKYVAGIFNWPKYQEVCVIKFSDTVKILEEYAQDFTSRPGSQPYAVVICDRSLNGTLQEDINKASEALNQKGLKCVWIGKPGNEEVGQQIAQQTGGVYMEYSDYEDAFSQLKDYLISQMPPKNNLYVTEVKKGETISYDKYYFDIEGDSSIPSTTKWYYRHIPGSDGLAAFSDKWLDEPVTCFDKDGIYYVSWQCKDNPKPADTDSRFANYRRDSIREEMMIIVGGTEPPTVQEIDPELTLRIGGYLKQNRKVTADLDIVLGTNEIDYSKTVWEITPLEEGNKEAIRIKNISDVKKYLLFKHPGKYRVKATIQDVKGNKFITQEDIDIVSDEPIEGEIYIIPETTYREANDLAETNVMVVADSPDDYIDYIKYYLAYDSDNDGSFDDETPVELDDMENLNMFDLEVNNGVGNYMLYVNVREGFLEETIPEFVTEEDYSKVSLQGNFTVGNRQPVYDIKPTKEVYLVGEEIRYMSTIDQSELKGYDYAKGYFDYEDDPMLYLKAKYTQDKSAMKNPDETSQYHNKQLDYLVQSLDRAGLYTITTCAGDDPKQGDERFASFRSESEASVNQIIVHRKPNAQAKFTATHSSAENYDFDNLRYLEGTELTIEDVSTDPDGFEVTTNLSYKTGRGDFKTINSGDTITLEYGQPITVKVETKDNWGAEDVEMYTIKVINDLDMIPEVIPSPVPASEDITLRLTTNQNAYSARAVVFGEEVQLKLVSETETQKIWENKYNIPATKKDDTYTAQFYAVSDEFIELRKDKDFEVLTPVNLVPHIDKTLITGDTINIKAFTSKYASWVNVTLYKGTSYAVTLNMNCLLTDEDKKIWNVLHTVPETLEDGEYKVEFVAGTANGNKESKLVDVFVQSLNIVSAALLPQPALAGDELIFTIETEGYADTIEIEVPNSIVSKDDREGKYSYPLKFEVNGSQNHKTDVLRYITNVNIDKTLTPDNKRLRPPYTFTVRAYKGDITREVDLELEVRRSVLDLIKPGVRDIKK